MKKNLSFWPSFCLIQALLSFPVLFAHEAPVDHLERELTISVEGNELRLSYRVQLPERAVMMQLKTMDTDNNGLVSSTERQTFFNHQITRIAGLLRISIGDKDYTFEPAGQVQLDAAFGQTFTFAMPIQTLKGNEYSATFSDDYSAHSPGGYRYVHHPGARQVKLIKAVQAQQYRQHPDRIAIRFNLDLK